MQTRCACPNEMRKVVWSILPPSNRYCNSSKKCELLGSQRIVNKKDRIGAHIAWPPHDESDLPMLKACSLWRCWFFETSCTRLRIKMILPQGSLWEVYSIGMGDIGRLPLAQALVSSTRVAVYIECICIHTPMPVALEGGPTCHVPSCTHNSAKYMRFHLVPSCGDLFISIFIHMTKVNVINATHRNANEGGHHPFWEYLR